MPRIDIQIGSTATVKNTKLYAPLVAIAFCVIVLTPSPARAEAPSDVTGTYVFNATVGVMSITDSLDVRLGGAATFNKVMKVRGRRGLYSSEGTWKVEGRQLVYTCSEGKWENSEGEMGTEKGYTKRFNIDSNGDLVAVVDDTAGSCRFVKRSTPVAGPPNSPK